MDPTRKVSEILEQTAKYACQHKISVTQEANFLKIILEF